ncbi:hypothetical protein Tco_1069745 [Tanacetum coccineum]|uniref:Uncharacterized protein n=1 Tax=Tanacetum coccineum TaxID=301880 RepID=A0ABQ5HLM6_9ASTR
MSSVLTLRDDTISDVIADKSSFVRVTQEGFVAGGLLLSVALKFGSAQLDYAAKSVVSGHGQYGSAPTVNPEGKVSEALGPSPTLRKRRALPDKIPKGMFRKVKSPIYSF